MEKGYTSIKEIGSRLLRHPMLQDLQMEDIIHYVIDFFSTLGLPTTFEDRFCVLHLHEYRAQLPCDCIEVQAIRKLPENIQLRATTDIFYMDHDGNRSHHSTFKVEGDMVQDATTGDVQLNYELTPDMRRRGGVQQYTYKIQGGIVYASIREGEIEVKYRATPVDKDGFPLLPKDDLFMQKQWFTILFETGKLQYGVLQNTQQEYAWKVGQYRTRAVLPSVAEMQSFTNMWNRLVPIAREFEHSFRESGEK